MLILRILHIMAPIHSQNDLFLKPRVDIAIGSSFFNLFLFSDLNEQSRREVIRQRSIKVVTRKAADFLSRFGVAQHNVDLAGVFQANRGNGQGRVEIDRLATHSSKRRRSNIGIRIEEAQCRKHHSDADGDNAHAVERRYGPFVVQQSFMKQLVLLRLEKGVKLDLLFIGEGEHQAFQSAFQCGVEGEEFPAQFAHQLAGGGIGADGKGVEPLGVDL